MTTVRVTITCTNADQGDGTPCPWYGRPREATISTGVISIGQGLFIKPLIACECGSYPAGQRAPQGKLTGTPLEELKLKGTPLSELVAFEELPGGSVRPIPKEHL